MLPRVEKQRRPWSRQEDLILSSSVAQYGSKRGPVTESRWSEISRGLPGRTNKDCRKRWFHSLDPTVRKGRWNETEDRTLMDAYNRMGPSWKEIAILDPSVKNRLAGWTPEEDQYLIKSASEIGHKWAVISAALPGRPPLTCRNRYRALKVLGKDVQLRTSDADDSPSSESSAMAGWSENPAPTDEEDHGPRQQLFAPLAIPDATREVVAIDLPQVSRLESLQTPMLHWDSSEMTFVPHSDQHMGVPDDMTMDHIIQNAMNAGLEDLDFGLCGNLSGADSMTGPWISETNMYSDSSSQYPANFGGNYAAAHTDNRSPSWNTTAGQPRSSQTRFGVGNQQMSSNPQHPVHIVHHHHVYHHHVHHTSPPQSNTQQ